MTNGRDMELFCVVFEDTISVVVVPSSARLLQDVGRLTARLMERDAICLTERVPRITP